MTAVVTTRCSRCGADLRDRTSRMFGIGPECRKAMTDADLREAMARNTPGHIPAERPTSGRAHAVNAAARQAAQPVTDRELCSCGSGAVKGRCPPCRVPVNPAAELAASVASTIARIRAERTAARDAQYEAWITHQPATTEGDPMLDPTKPEDVPAELVEAVVQAVGCPLPAMSRDETRQAYREILAVARPAHEAIVRAKVGGDIDAHRCDASADLCANCSCRADLAALARGKQ